jgi:phospholipid transport system substrate-binding protein
VMKAGPTAPFPHRYAMLAPVIESVFDLPGILRACVGPRWTALAPEDRAELLAVFRRFTVASYVANFDDYAGERFEMLPDSRAAGGGEVVGTRIVGASGRAVRIDYVMRQEADAWKAVDVLLDGTISRVAVQRSDFRGLLGDGPDASSLIVSLQRKVADLSRGTMSAG